MFLTLTGLFVFFMVATTPDQWASAAGNVMGLLLLAAWVLSLAGMLFTSDEADRGENRHYLTEAESGEYDHHD